jgi:N-ethylmaleimide reductase
MNNLFTPLPLRQFTLPNRILLAPLTRCRAEEEHVPSDLMATYYAQRASAGLIIAEATMVMKGCSAFWTEPGIHSEAQVEGWKKTTGAVHAAGGRIFLQLWHGGRACHPLMNQGAVPVAPSPLAITNDMVRTPTGTVPHVVPRELPDEEIPGVVEGFGIAAANAKSAGFDGVEVHGANGYLLDAFLRDGANQRAGRYGGALENRARLLLEVIEKVAGVWGSGRVGVRVSPLNSYNSMSDSDPVGLTRWLGERLNDFDLAYLHLMRSDFLGQQTGDVLTPAREAFKGVLIGNMGYSGEEAAQAVAEGKLDAVAFGTGFLASPDLPERIRVGAKWNVPDPATFYSRGAAGYTDYPRMAAGAGGV